MKVNDSVTSASAAASKSVVGKGPSATTETTESARSEAASRSGSGSGETVRIDPRSSQLAAAAQVLDDTPVVDAARVAEVREAIASGRFRVDAEQTAERLVNSVRDLILTQRN